MLTENLFSESPAFHHHFQLVDQANQNRLSEHCSIHVLELEIWRYSEVLNAENEWLYFYKEAENWQEIPEIINTPKMRQAMAVLERFSEKERDYHLYQARQNAIREEQTRQKLLEEALRDKEEALRREEEALRREEEERKLKEEAQNDRNRLRELLKKQELIRIDKRFFLGPRDRHACEIQKKCQSVAKSAL